MICHGFTLDGQPCPNKAMHGSEFCFGHNPDPAVKARRIDARRKGGRARRVNTEPRESLTASQIQEMIQNLSSREGVREVVATTILLVQNKQIDSKSSNAIAKQLQMLMSVFPQADVPLNKRGKQN